MASYEPAQYDTCMTFQYCIPNKIRIECWNLIGWEPVHTPAHELAYGPAELQFIKTKENTDFCGFTCVGIQ